MMISSEVQWIAYQRGSEVPVYRLLRNFLCEAFRRDTGYRAIGNGVAAPETPSGSYAPSLPLGAALSDDLAMRHSTHRRIAPCARDAVETKPAGYQRRSAIICRCEAVFGP